MSTRLIRPPITAVTKHPALQGRLTKPVVEEPSNIKEPIGKDLVSKIGGMKGSPGDKLWRAFYKSSFEDNKYE